MVGLAIRSLILGFIRLTTKILHMSTGFRFRAYPSDAVARVLLRWIGCQRFIYNAKVREDQYHRSFQRKALALAGRWAPVDQAYAHFIGDGNGCEGASTTWLREVPSHVLRNGAVRWYQAYQRFFKGLARRPTIQHRYGEQSVWLTSELFEFKPVVGVGGEITGWRLLIGTRKFPCGELPFVAHRSGWAPPKTIHVSVHAGRWHVSFSHENHEAPVPTEADTLAYLRQFGREELLQRTVGLDRGVAIPLVASGAQGDALRFELLDVHKKRLARKDALRKRWQRRAARRVKGSKNRAKAQLRVARCSQYAADVRKNLAHQASRALVNSDALLFVFESLKVKSMTRSAKGTVDEPGQRVAQKKGLNRAILGSAWAAVKLYTTYKAIAAGKLVIDVPPRHSSQECSHCGHTHADNRPGQARFVCQRCGHAENADANAARVLAKRGVDAVVSGSYTLRQRKKVGSIRRQPAQQDLSSGPERSSVSAEAAVSRRERKLPVHVPEKQKTPVVRQETPTTSALAV